MSKAVEYMIPEIYAPPTPEQARAASLTLAAHADSHEELDTWLQMLGLHPAHDLYTPHKRKK